MSRRSEYVLQRFSSDTDSTLGALFREAQPARKPADRKFICFTLEDERRERKVPGETRIPKGRYQIKLREVGGMHAEYKAKFPWHRGMLHLQDVPGFTWIYLHPGATDEHTAGCVLTGSGAWQNVTRAGQLLDPVDAYRRLYADMLADLTAGQVFINVKEYA